MHIPKEKNPRAECLDSRGEGGEMMARYKRVIKTVITDGKKRKVVCLERITGTESQKKEARG